MCVLTNIETHQCYQKWKKLLKNHQDERVSTLGNSVWREEKIKKNGNYYLYYYKVICTKN